MPGGGFSAARAVTAAGVDRRLAFGDGRDRGQAECGDR